MTLSNNAKKILDGRYRQKKEDGTFIESHEDIFRRVAVNLASVEKDEVVKKDLESAIYNDLTLLNWLPNTPTLCNAGTNNGLGYNACYIIGLEDSIVSERTKHSLIKGKDYSHNLNGDSITDAVQICALITKTGGGVGYTLDKLRPTGDWISTSKSHSGGPMGFWQVLAAMSGAMQQGGKRRGANMMTMSLWHPDILKFITAKDEFDPWMTEVLGYKARRFGNFNISVKISDEEMKNILNYPNLYFNVTNPRTQKRYFIPKSVNIKNYQLSDLYERPDTGVVQGDADFYTYGDIWQMIVDRAHSHADPGILFWDRVMERNMLPEGYEPITTNPCSEIPGEPNMVCNLASLNLANFVTAKKISSIKEFDRHVNWDSLLLSWSNLIRSLDNVVDATPYPTKDIELNAKRWRRLGAGVMGLADMLYKLEIPYNSKLAYDVCGILGRSLYSCGKETSRKLYQEKGCSTEWLDHQNSKNIPEDKKTRNAYIFMVAPTGCQKSDSLILTSNGIFELQELMDINGARWQNTNISVMQESEFQLATKGFINGEVLTKKIKTKSGIDLECTPNHQYRVLKNGEYVWKRADELSRGDRLVYRIGGYEKTENPELSQISIPTDDKTKYFEQPKYLSPKLAYLIGLINADGSIHDKGLRIHCNPNDQNFIQDIIELIKEIFPGLEPKKLVERTCDSIYINSIWLIRFLDNNGLLKKKAHEVYIPKLIRMSSKDSIYAFLHGYWDGDGSRTGYTLYIDTVSYKMAQQLAVLGRAVGMNTYIREDKSINKRKGNRTKYRIYRKSFGSFGKATDKAKGIKRIDKDLKKELSKYGSELMFDYVTEVTNSQCLTMDIEVPINNTYLANSYVSHNTISIIANTSAAIEPLYALVLKRQVMRDHTGKAADTELEVNEHFKNYLDDNFTKEQASFIVNFAANHNGSIKNLTQNHLALAGLLLYRDEAAGTSWEQINEKLNKLKCIFVTAMDISWQEHLKMQEVWTKEFTNKDGYSQGLSKTINLQSDASKEDINNLYRLAWESECIGITMYRDGSHDGQPMTTEKKPEAEKSIKEIVNKSPDIKPIPEINQVTKSKFNIKEAVILSTRTSVGNLRLVVGFDQNKPTETFVIASKQGTDVASMCDALGRTISISLQNGVPKEKIVETLKNISGGTPSMSNGITIKSIPDAISQMLDSLKISPTSTDKIQKEVQEIKQTLAIKKEYTGNFCPDCGSNLEFSSGCKGGLCNNCGFSSC